MGTQKQRSFAAVVVCGVLLVLFLALPAWGAEDVQAGEGQMRYGATPVTVGVAEDGDVTDGEIAGAETGANRTNADVASQDVTDNDARTDDSDGFGNAADAFAADESVTEGDSQRVGDEEPDFEQSTTEEAESGIESPAIEESVPEESALEESIAEEPADDSALEVQDETSLDSAASDSTSIAGAVMAPVSTQSYTGKAIRPAPRLTLAGSVLKRGSDYTLSYKNNTGVGTATITATGIGVYEGSLSRTFRISYDLSKAQVSLPKTSYTYTGKAIKPVPTVTCAGAKLKSGTHYVVSYASNTKVGTATLTIKARTNAMGNKKKTFKVVARSLANASVAAVTNKRYTGKAITPTPSVKLSGQTLRKGTDYTLAYRNNTKVGTATIVVKGKGNYCGTKSRTFRIVKATTSVRGPKSAGALKVKGNKLVDKNGKAIQLKGVSTHGLAWYPDYVNDACFKQLRTKWRANVVRLAMYTEEYGGYCSGGNQTALLNLVKKGVRLATQNDLYVIVDWHILQDGNPNTHLADAKSFFSKVSSAFKNNDNVIYEICNEPNGGTTWAQIKSYANKVIPVIRKNDPDAVVLVGTPTWSQEIDKAAASPLKYANVMYTMHFYAATHKDDLRNRLASVVKGGLPVFVSEFGICDASGNGAIDTGSANSWATTMKSLGVSWCMWSLCNKAESASILKSSCAATSGFKTGDLSTSGTWLLKALNGSLPAGSDASAAVSSDTGTTSGSGSAVTGKAVSFTSGNLACKAVLVSSWSAGNGKTCYQYDLTITNKGAARSSWSVTVPFNKSVTFTNGWNGTYKASGTKLSVRSMDYNGSLAKGGSATGIGFQVTAASGLVVKP